MAYDTLRHFADTWGLLAMLAFFLGAVLFAFRPGSRRHYEEAARIPLKNDFED
jgi:cytochrome c oxidase cbb3-type subunit 4